MKIFKHTSNPNSKNDWLILDLPTVLPEQAPVGHPAPTPQAAFQHSLELSQSVQPKTWEERRQLMNPIRFKW